MRGLRSDESTDKKNCHESRADCTGIEASLAGGIRRQHVSCAFIPDDAESDSFAPKGR